MRKVVAISALSVLAAGSVAIGVQQMRSPHEAMTADLERDLSLANSVQQTRLGVVSALEQGANGGPSGNEVGKRAMVLTNKRAPSAAPSKTVTLAAATPTDRVDPAEAAPPSATPPLDSATSSPEPI
ncbi:MAG: hypothetical protein ABI852_14135, partial [Gemmatimonadaceae bacterium]